MKEENPKEPNFSGPVWTKLKDEHRTFLLEMAEHGDKFKAYKVAYPNSSGRSMVVCANRLARDKEIQSLLQEAEEAARKKLLAELEEKTKERVKEGLVTMQEKRELLASMIRGQYKYKRKVKLNDRLEDVEEDLNPFALLRAIELDTKLEEKYFGKQEKEEEKEPLVTGTRKIIIGGKDIDAEEYNYYGWHNLPPNHPFNGNTHGNPGKNVKWIDPYIAEERMAALHNYKTGYCAALGIPRGTSMKHWEGGKYVNLLPPWYDRSKDPVEEHPMCRLQQQNSNGPLRMPYEEKEGHTDWWQLPEHQAIPPYTPPPIEQQNDNNLNKQAA